MSKLQARLDRIKAAFQAEAPADALTTMERAAAELEASDILARIPKVGATLPPFELSDTDGEPIRSSDLLASGPLVVSVYRGLW